jgi:adenosylhomocysteine nucleosidase
MSIGIIAALPGELKPLVAGWRQVEAGVWSGTTGGQACVAAADGMGHEAARRACEKVFAMAGDAGPIDTLYSVGWAGSLSCGAKPPDAWEVSEVIDARTGERFLAGPEEPGPEQPDKANGIRLVTLDHVAGVAEKRQLAERYQAVMVDMEAATVARLARERGVQFRCVKGISDGATDRLPDFSRFISARGQLRMPAFLAHVALRPGYWRNLARLGKNSGQAAENLAVRVREMVASGSAS